MIKLIEGMGSCMIDSFFVSLHSHSFRPISSTKVSVFSHKIIILIFILTSPSLVGLNSQKTQKKMKKPYSQDENCASCTNKTVFFE